MFEINQFKDIIVIIGDNESGKTSIVQKLFLPKMKKDSVFVINSSHEDSWAKYISEDHIFSPSIFDIDWLEKVILLIVSSNLKSITLIIDDIDNFQVKFNNIIKSIAVNLRHINTGLIITSRSLVDIPRVIYKQSRYIFIGYQSSDYDIYYIATIIGYKNAETLKSLKQFEFAVWDRKTKSLRRVKLDSKLF
ncbi:MAG: ATPase/DNA packaging protein [Thermoplasmata archaeon]